ncbi:hypothetical protein CHARACLAT_002971 [Characodon lateralis]|uniref:Uncharacterized protein n=1 Tax=Characodon lateralis TaxID=208331 RepID=A0ABU7D451_9TELE|nr:hypothetical protein [Characodon lateralis]
MQKPQEAAATSPQAPPAAVHARADPAMDPEAQDPGTHYPPSRGPTEPRGPGPGKQPPGVSQPTPKHPAADIENHKYTSRQRLQPPAGGVAGRKLIQEREQFKTQPVAKKKQQADSHNHPLPP